MFDKIQALIERFFNGKNRVKVPTILQMEATECGAASLSMILSHYGKWLPLEKLRQECGVNRDGSKVSCVIRTAPVVAAGKFPQNNLIAEEQIIQDIFRG